MTQAKPLSISDSAQMILGMMGVIALVAIAATVETPDLKQCRKWQENALRIEALASQITEECHGANITFSQEMPNVITCHSEDFVQRHLELLKKRRYSEVTQRWNCQKPLDAVTFRKRGR